MSVKPTSEPSVIQGLHSWLTTECAKQNMHLGTERDLYKSEVERLSSGYDTVSTERDQLAADNKRLRGALMATCKASSAAEVGLIVDAALSSGKEVV